MGGDSEVKPGMFGDLGKRTSKDKGPSAKGGGPTRKGGGKKKRKSYFLDPDTLDGLEQIVNALRERGIRTDTNREMTEHFLVINLLAQDVQDILEGRRKVVLPSATAQEVEVEL